MRVEKVKAPLQSSPHLPSLLLEGSKSVSSSPSCPKLEAASKWNCHISWGSPHLQGSLAFSPPLKPTWHAGLSPLLASTILEWLGAHDIYSVSLCHMCSVQPGPGHFCKWSLAHCLRGCGRRLPWQVAQRPLPLYVHFCHVKWGVLKWWHHLLQIGALKDSFPQIHTPFF